MNKEKKREIASKASSARISTPRKKKVFLDALYKSYGVIQPALDAAGIVRSTYHNWINNDPKFAEEVQNANDAGIDFVQGQLYKNIKAGKEISCIFYLKTKAAHLGYYEKTQLDITSGGQKIEFHFGNNDQQKLEFKEVKHIEDKKNEDDDDAWLLT